MFAVYVEKPEKADPLSAVVLGERPEPRAPEGWVRVKVSHASLNRHDIFTMLGVTGQDTPIPLPHDPGQRRGGRVGRRQPGGHLPAHRRGRLARRRNPRSEMARVEREDAGDLRGVCGHPPAQRHSPARGAPGRPCRGAGHGLAHGLQDAVHQGRAASRPDHAGAGGPRGACPRRSSSWAGPPAWRSGPRAAAARAGPWPSAWGQTWSWPTAKPCPARRTPCSTMWARPPGSTPCAPWPAAASS